MLVSIIITSYNYEKYLKEAIDSALSQTYPSIEVIVIDDGSKDNSAEIIRGYKDKIIPILKDNGGQTSCFNIAFEKSRGDVVIFLDADDVLLENAVADHMQYLKNPEVSKSCGYMEVIDSDGNLTGDRVPRKLRPGGDYRDVALNNGLGVFQPSFTSGNAWARWFLEKVLPLPENDIIGADGYLTSIDLLFGKIETVSRTVVKYRLHGKNKGPLYFSFDKAHMKKLLQKRDFRLNFAEGWIKKLGYQQDEKEFRKIRNWKLALMAYILGRMGEPYEAAPSGIELVAMPFQGPNIRPWNAFPVSFGLCLIYILPKKPSISLARYMLTKTNVIRD
ncbi:MAG: glycosyltransferase [Arenicellales bacterium]